MHSRAKLYEQIRAFFKTRAVLEVETSLLCKHTVTDIHIESIPAQLRFGNQTETQYLQTSPEYAMKKLLADGSGPIFQICKAFRNGDRGRQHNPEFTMLEWYRPGFNHHDLMTEMDDLFQLLLNCRPAEKISYRNLFLQYLDFDPLNATEIECKTIIQHKNISIDYSDFTKDDCLQILLSECIEPKIGQEKPIFIFDYPASQAALANIRQETPPIGERFEAYFKGFELANGFHELTNADEQLSRFQHDQEARKARGLSVPSIDMNFIAALKKGLPACSGVAVGLDRLLMIIKNTNDISTVII